MTSETGRKIKEYKQLIDFIHTRFGIDNFISSEEMAREFVLTKLPDEENIESSIEKIFVSTCDKYSVTRKEILAETKGNRMITEARQMITFLLMTRLGLSSTTAAKKVNRDHTTALHSKRQIEDRISTNQLLVKFPF